MRKPAIKVAAPVARHTAGASEPQLRDILRRSLVWFATGDLTFPWKATPAKSDAARESLKIRLNDFPDEQMYTLLVGRREVGSFDEWPSNWKRGGAVNSERR